MRKFLFNFCMYIFLPVYLFAQEQTPDDVGYTQASYIKQIDKDADYGAYLIVKQFEFGTGKGLDKMPVVTAFEKGDVEMVSVNDNIEMGYLLPYNNFMTVDNYDFEVFNRNKFKSQKYEPYRLSLSSDDIFIDDNFGLVYGFNADQQGQRCRFTYDYKYTDAKYLTRIFFHQNIPVKSMTVSFRIPSWLMLDIQEKNFDGYKITKDIRDEKGGFTVITYTAQNLSSVKQEASSLAKP